MVLGQVLKDSPKIQIRTITLIQWEEFIRSVVQFFQIWFKYATWKPTTTPYIPQTARRHILLAGSLDKCFSVQAALIYLTFLNSTWSSTPSKLELKAVRKVLLALISSTFHPHTSWWHLFSVSGTHHNFRSHWFCPSLYSTGLPRQWWDAASTLTFNSCLFVQVAAAESNSLSYQAAECVQSNQLWGKNETWPMFLKGWRSPLHRVASLSKELFLTRMWKLLTSSSYS